ncbi:MAG: insulinase family protein, partial [Gemmatimonadetes bacterium]|nr:insulinase family protein [Gemmatimonadota bacterium]
MIHPDLLKFFPLLVVTSLSVDHLTAQVPDREHPPELGEPPSLNLPPYSELSLSNGLRVMLMEKHNVPIVQLSLTIRTGSVMDPQDQAGLASMTAAMLDEGAGARSALELSDEIDFLGASLSTGAGLHTTSVSLRTPLSKFDQALALMSDVVLRP